MTNPPSTRFHTTPEVRDRPTYHSAARSLCPHCGRLVDAARILTGGRVVLEKQCPEHGASRALLSADADWFLRSLTFLRPASIPRRHATHVRQGCPQDCGLCPDHEQHTCLPIIEVTDRCDMDCPICLVDAGKGGHMSVNTFTRILDGLVAAEGSIDTVNLSGGEPTMHPEFLDLVDLARRPEISRVSVSTNGLRLAREPDLCRRLADRGVYVNLQYDGPGDHGAALRGRNGLAEAKHTALRNLAEAGARATLVVAVARGINDTDIGACIDLLLAEDGIFSLMFQPMTHTGRGRSFEPQDPLDRLTIPEMLRRIEEQTSGRIAAADFVPLPCSHPSCFALTYLLRRDNDFVPFSRFLPVDRYLDLLANRGTMRPDGAFEDAMRSVIDELWSGSARLPESEKTLAALRRGLDLLYPRDRALESGERLRVGEGLVKTVFLHAFMDVHSFELERMRKCCTHYALPDGRLMPACGYNVLRRNTRPREASRSWT